MNAIRALCVIAVLCGINASKNCLFCSIAVSFDEMCFYFQDSNFFATVTSDDADGAKLAIANGEDVNASDETYGWSPLHHAAHQGTL